MRHVLSGVCLAATLTVVAAAQDGGRGAIARGEWPSYGGDLANSRYSPQDQITRDGKQYIGSPFKALRRVPRLFLDAFGSELGTPGIEWPLSPGRHSDDVMCPTIKTCRAGIRRQEEHERRETAAPDGAYQKK